MRQDREHIGFASGFVLVVSKIRKTPKFRPIADDVNKRRNIQIYDLCCISVGAKLKTRKYDYLFLALLDVPQSCSCIVARILDLINFYIQPRTMLKCQ